MTADVMTARDAGVVSSHLIVLEERSMPLN